MSSWYANELNCQIQTPATAGIADAETDRLSEPVACAPNYLLCVRSGVVGLLRGQSIFDANDNDQFVDVLIFDRAISGVDTHAKPPTASC